MYVPDGAATNWQDKDIRHDTHGGKMFEDDEDAKNLVYWEENRIDFLGNRRSYC